MARGGHHLLPVGLAILVNFLSLILLFWVFLLMVWFASCRQIRDMLIALDVFTLENFNCLTLESVSLVAAMRVLLMS